MKCSMCSIEFEEKEAKKSCAACMLLGKCTLLRCPGCGYEMPPESKWLKSLFANAGSESFSCLDISPNGDNCGDGNDAGLSSLTSLKVNARAVVSSIKADNPRDMKKLVSLGILPGVEITLLQKYPSYVFNVWRTQFAVDEELAGCIYVAGGDRN